MRRRPISKPTASGHLVLALLLTALLVSQAGAQWTDTIFPTSNTNRTCISATGNPGDGWHCMAVGWYSTISWYVDQSDFTQAGQVNILAAVNNQFDPTDLVFNTNTFEPNPNYHTNAWRTDIIIEKEALPPGLAGVAYCDNVWVHPYCDQHFVLIETSTPTQALMCHEIGHAVGLMHGDGISMGPNHYTVSNTDLRMACMTTPLDNNRWWLGPWNEDSINHEY